MAQVKKEASCQLSYFSTSRVKEIKKGKDIKAGVSLKGIVLIKFFSHNVLVKNPRDNLTSNTEPHLALKSGFKSKRTEIMSCNNCVEYFAYTFVTFCSQLLILNNSIWRHKAHIVSNILSFFSARGEVMRLFIHYNPHSLQWLGPAQICMQHHLDLSHTYFQHVYVVVLLKSITNL